MPGEDDTFFGDERGSRSPDADAPPLLPIAVLNLDDSVVHLNSAMRARLLGLSDPQRTAEDVLRDATSEVAAAVRAGGATGTAEVRGADGTTGLQLSWSVLSWVGGLRPSVMLVPVAEDVSTPPVVDSRWRQVLARAVDLTWTADAAGTVLSITPGLSLGTAWSSEKLVGHHWIEFVHPQDRAVGQAMWERVIHGGRSDTQAFEARAGLGDGAWHWLRITLSDLRNDPAIGVLVGTAVGITDAGVALVSSPELNAEFRARYTQSGLPQMMLDRAGRIVSVNDAYCELLGRERQELVGIDGAALMHPDDETGTSAFNAIIASGIDHARIARVLLGPQARAIPVEVDVTILRGQAGDVVGAAAFVHDLSEIGTPERLAMPLDPLAITATFLEGDMGLVSDVDGTIAYITPELARVLGSSVEDLVGSIGLARIHPDDLPDVMVARAQVVADGEVRTLEYRLRAGDDGWRWFQARVARFSDPSLEGLVVSLRDITAQLEAENVLKSAAALHDAIAAATVEGILAVSATGRTLYANERVAALLGVTLPDLYLHPPPFVGALDGLPSHDVAYTRPDGAELHLSATTTPLTAPDGTITGSLLMINDVTDGHRRAAQLLSAAAQDALTGLLNRASFLTEVDRALARHAADVGVLFANLDNFRALNDSLGRAAGDQALVEVADRVRHAVGGHSVARVGADEFAVLVVDAEPAQMESLGRAVLAAIARPLELEGVSVDVTAAMGLATSSDVTAEGLVHCADIAMRAAKESGAGSLGTFDQRRADASQLEDALGPDLREALAGNHLDMHFQPIIDLATGAVLGMEALARWTHATVGPIDPRRIVATAERFDLSSELDRWALRTAFRGARALQRAGAAPREAYVSVNLTAGNLLAPGLEDYIVREVEHAGLTPAHVLLEMTENALMGDAALVTGMLRRLRTLGFRVAIDDFGTGYSSLAYLRDLPISMLKIDRSFVAGIRSDSDALAIVTSIIHLARAIGITAVAKGAETLDQAGLLRELGCQCAQGWLWSPAMSLEELIATRAWAKSFDVGADRSAAVPVRRERFPVGPEHGLDRMLAMQAKGASLSTIAASLNADGYFTPKGLRWHGTSVARAIADAAYARRDSI